MRNTVFLDLDETLITTFPAKEMENLEEAVATTTMRLATAYTPSGIIFRRKMLQIYQYRLQQRELCAHLDRDLAVMRRPSAQEAINAFSSLGDVHLFTAADLDYARTALAVAGIKIPGELYSTREEAFVPADISRTSAWVLIDDLLNGEKVRMLGEADVSKFCLQIPLLDYGSFAHPLTDFVEEACRKLMQQQMERAV
jgi:hypothetical protein